MFPFINTFVDLGTALGKKVASVFTGNAPMTQNAPAPAPVNTNSYSFDFMSGLRNLSQGLGSILSVPAGGAKTVNAVNNLGTTVLDSINKNVGTAIDKLFGNANTKPSITDVSVSNQPYAPGGNNTFPSQTGLSLADIMTLINPARTATPAASTTAPNNMILIIGFVALSGILLLSRKAA